MLYFPLHCVCIEHTELEGQGGHGEGGDVDLRLCLLLGEEGEDVHAEGVISSFRSCPTVSATTSLVVLVCVALIKLLIIAQKF